MLEAIKVVSFVSQVLKITNGLIVRLRLHLGKNFQMYELSWQRWLMREPLSNEIISSVRKDFCTKSIKLVNQAAGRSLYNKPLSFFNVFQERGEFIFEYNCFTKKIGNFLKGKNFLNHVKCLE